MRRQGCLGKGSQGPGEAGHLPNVCVHVCVWVRVGMCVFVVSVIVCFVRMACAYECWCVYARVYVCVYVCGYCVCVLCICVHMYI